MNKSLAIVGSHPKTRELAPFDNPSVDIWVFNEAANQAWCKRADAVFQLHAPSIYRSPHNRSDPAHFRWLQQPHDRLVVYMQEVDPVVPTSARYPLEAVVNDLLPGFRQGIERNLSVYFTSTTAYALALAIHKGYEKIEIYGIEMGTDTEYQYQRPCFLFWVGLGLGRGIAIDFVSGDEIFNVLQYGYEGAIESQPEEFAQRSEELRLIIGQLLDSKAEAEKELRIGGVNGNLGDMITSLVQIYGDLGEAEGRMHENDRYAYQAKDTPFIDRNEYESQAAAYEPMIEKHNEILLKSSGVINYIMRAWIADHDPSALAQIKILTQKMCETAYQRGRARGIYNENAAFMVRWDRRMQAAGGTKAAEIARMEP